MKYSIKILPIEASLGSFVQVYFIVKSPPKPCGYKSPFVVLKIRSRYQMHIFPILNLLQLPRPS